MANGSNLAWIAGTIWSIADDVLRDVYVRGKYRDVILPMTVLRRLDAVLEPSKQEVLNTKAFLDKSGISSQDAPLRQAAEQAFYNTSRFTLHHLRAKAGRQQLRADFETYLDGFSPNVQDILDNFEFRNQLPRLSKADALGALIEKFTSPAINLSPNPVVDPDGTVRHPGLDNHGMGTVFEELIRRFNEENNEEAGEHFTPREVIKLMTHLIFGPLKGKLKNGAYLIYDPACGSGGMLTEAELFAKQINPKATFELYGQEVQPETFAICKADMLIKDKDPEKIAFGSTLSEDGFPGLKFDFMISNPPYGKTWKKDKDAILDGKDIIDRRFAMGVPRINDGQLLFDMNMVGKMKANSELGSRFATIHNGSALFTGDAGQGEADIRKYLFENDLLEAVIALPCDLFYNTGIPTYIFVMANKKEERRKGKLQLIDASGEGFHGKMRKPLGKKREELGDGHIATVTGLFMAFEDGGHSRVLDNEDFGYRQVTVHRPRKDGTGRPKSDTDLRDKENIPMKEDIDAFFEREVLPFAADAWYDPKETKTGYEINFAKYFHKYQGPRPTGETKSKLLALRKETQSILDVILS